MRKIPSNFIVLLLVLLSPLLCRATETQISSMHLEADTDSKRIWLIQVIKNPASAELPLQSIIWARQEGSKTWQPAGSIPAAVSQVTHYGDQLVALLNDGQWQFVGQSSGRSLPDAAQLVALAGDRNSLWALGRPKQPTSQPATQPATRPASGLTLYHLERDAWVSQVTLSPDTQTAPAVLGICNSRPTIAYALGQSLKLAQLKVDGALTDLGSQPLPPNTRPLRLLGSSGRAFLLVGSDSGPLTLLVYADKWLPNLSLDSTGPVRTLGIAGGMLRLVYLQDNKVMERLIDPRLATLDGPPTPLALPHIADTRRMYDYLQWAMMALLALVMVQTYRNRGVYQQIKIDWSTIQLAPFGRRFLAALIDLAPMMIVSTFLRMSSPMPESLADAINEVYQSPDSFMYMGISTAVYIAYTALSEAFFGRTPGKMLLGLYVVRLDGLKASIGALLLRNILRVLDMWLSIFALVLIFFLPLRQRVGDLAAGTMVVIRTKQPPAP